MGLSGHDIWARVSDVDLTKTPRIMCFRGRVSFDRGYRHVRLGKDFDACRLAGLNNLRVKRSGFA
jgi:hypothetical protein